MQKSPFTFKFSQGRARSKWVIACLGHCFFLWQRMNAQETRPENAPVDQSLNWKTLLCQNSCEKDLILKTPSLVFQRNLVPTVLFLQFEGGLEPFWENAFQEIEVSGSPLRAIFEPLKNGAWKRHLAQSSWNSKFVYRRLSEFPNAVDELAMGYAHQPRLMPHQDGESLIRPDTIFFSTGKLKLRPGGTWFFDLLLHFDKKDFTEKGVASTAGYRQYTNFFGGWIRSVFRLHGQWDNLQNSSLASQKSEGWAFPTHFFVGAGVEFRFIRWLVGELSVINRAISQEDFCKSFFENKGYLEKYRVLKTFLLPLSLQFSVRLQPCRPTHWLLAPPLFASSKNVANLMQIAPSEHLSFLKGVQNIPGEKTKAPS